MTVIERIKETARSKKNISITVLEQELGYSNGSLAKAKDIPSSRIMEIAHYLGVSMDFLMTGIEPAGYIIYHDGMEIFVELQRKADADEKFYERMKKYMELLKSGNTVVDEMIDFQYDKQKKAED